MASSPSSAPPPTSSPAPPASSAPPPAATTNPPPAATTTPPPAATTNPSAPPPSNATTIPGASPSLSPPAVPSIPPASPSLSPPPSSTATPPPPSSTATPPPPSSTATSPPPSSTATQPPPSTESPSPPSSTTPSPPSTTTPSPPSTTTPSPPTSRGGGRSSSSSSPPAAAASGSGTPSSGGGDSSSSSIGLVVGLVAGGAVLLLLLTLVCACCRKKRRDERYHGGRPLPPTRKDNGYAGQPQSWQHNVHPPEDHAIKVPPHLSPPPAHASRPPQPPPPPIFSSSGASGSNYSGPDTPLCPPSPGMALGFSKSTFTFEELVRATDGFSDANLLGQGGFGYVHRGMFPNGKEVAVKQLKTGSGQGEREFQAEVEIISRVHHKHLVSLVGYCIAGGKRLLIYEFVPNNTLEFHLHGKGRPTMEWSTRLKIALGSAKGLAYLHEDCHPKIIHRDIKAANILLDFKFEAKVADFGLAKFSADNNTHVSTRIMGTFGYLAPEYASSGKLTEKSDVFSFGVMLLELITGRRPVDTTNTYMDDSLVDWARPLLTRALEDHSFGSLVDPRLKEYGYDPREMSQMVACAAACVRHSARRRARMSQIVRALEGDVSLEDLNEGVRPGHSTVYGTLASSEYDTSRYNEDMKKFRKLALTGEDYGSSENGQNPSGSSSEPHIREMKDSGGFM